MASQIHATEHRVVEGAVRSRGLHPRERLMLEAVECLGGNGRNVEDVVFCIGFSSRSQNLGAAMGGGGNHPENIVLVQGCCH